VIDAPHPELFDLTSLQQQAELAATVGGRGTSSIVHFPDRSWVLRHYRRGGLVGKVLNDQYFGFQPEKSRSWSEWRLLGTLFTEGFPVPRPIAASVTFHSGYYQADIITEYIPETKTLAQLLVDTDLDLAVWAELGQCIGRFHKRGVDHADLNAHNILVDCSGAVYLLDFDRGCFRPAGQWQKRNLLRLRRSLLKVAGINNRFHFHEKGWSSLLNGYGRSEE